MFNLNSNTENSTKVVNSENRKILNEMLDKREYGLDFDDPNEFKLFVSENYDISEQGILDIWNSYRPSCEDFEELVDLP